MEPLLNWMTCSPCRHCLRWKLIPLVCGRASSQLDLSVLFAPEPVHNVEVGLESMVEIFSDIESISPENVHPQSTFVFLAHTTTSLAA